MPDGRVHSTASLAGAIVVPAAMVYYGFPISESLACSLGFLVSLKVNPDLDLNSRFPRKKPAKWLWWLMWLPYSRLIGHRSPFSHFPIIGTALRIMYLLPLGLMGFRLIGVSILVPQGVIEYLIFGLAISDIIHWAMDILSTAIKKR